MKRKYKRNCESEDTPGYRVSLWVMGFFSSKFPDEMERGSTGNLRGKNIET